MLLFTIHLSSSCGCQSTLRPSVPTVFFSTGKIQRNPIYTTSTPSRVWWAFLNIRWKVENFKYYSPRQITHSLCSIVPAHSDTKSLQMVRVTNSQALKNGFAIDTQKIQGLDAVAGQIWDDTNQLKLFIIWLTKTVQIVQRYEL